MYEDPTIRDKSCGTYNARTGIAKVFEVDGGTFFQSVEGAQLDQVELLVQVKNPRVERVGETRSWDVVSTDLGMEQYLMEKPKPSTIPIQIGTATQNTGL